MGTTDTGDRRGAEEFAVMHGVGYNGRSEQFTDPDELLEYLDVQGKTELCRFDQILADEDIPEVTLEQLDQILKGITIPVEEYLQEERAKVDDPFRF